MRGRTLAHTDRSPAARGAKHTHRYSRISQLLSPFAASMRRRTNAGARALGTRSPMLIWYICVITILSECSIPFALMRRSQRTCLRVCLRNGKWLTMHRSDCCARCAPRSAVIGAIAVSWPSSSCGAWSLQRARGFAWHGMGIGTRRPSVASRPFAR